MAPKARKDGGKGKASGGAEDERELPLQAVVFADSYETRLAPFTQHTPRCLLPLANTPLLEYTLEFLAGAGAEEVFVYAGNHVDVVEDYLRSSRWMRSTAPFALELVRSPARSVGDAMRDLEQKQLILGDFVCVYGDVVANISLGPALAAHRARRERDKNAIMTMVLREADGAHRSAPQHPRSAFVLDPARQRCVHYEQIVRGRGNSSSSPRLELPAEVLAEAAELEVREDLIDCGIDICTPEVLAQYTDNFDWQLPRRGFLRGVLKDYDTMQLTVHAHVASSGYAARVRSLRAYDAISRDVLARWAYPLSPDVNLLADQSYRMQKGNIYREDGVVLSRSCVVGRGSMLGKAASVGDKSVITNSVIGRRCVIGKRVRITDAYIWDDARIGDDAVVERSIVGDEVSVGRKCEIRSGTLLSHGVRIADGTVVAGKRVTTLRRQRGYEVDELVEAPSDPKIVGQGGVGFEMQADDDDDDEVTESLLPTAIDAANDPTLSDDSVSVFSSEEEDSEEDFVGHAAQGRSESFLSIGSEDSGGARRAAAADFHHEATSSIVDALQKYEDADTIQLELQALKLSTNAEDKQVRRAVATALARRIAALVAGSGDDGSIAPKDAVAAVLPPNRLLVERCVATEGNADDPHAEQAEFLLYLQSELAQRTQGEKVLLFLCNALATDDLVEAEGFETWWEDPRSSATDDMQRTRMETKQLVDVLVGDDDDDSDEEESESDDE